MIYYFIINDILLHQSNALDAQDDVFWLIKRELLKDESIQIEKKGTALYINKVYYLGECARGLYKKKNKFFCRVQTFRYLCNVNLAGLPTLDY